VPTILVFAKEPVAGQVKTRLVPPLSPDQAARLAGAFLVDLVRALDALPADLEIAVPPDSGRGVLGKLLGPDRQWLDQGPGDLGARLARTTTAAFDRRPGPVAVVGSDHPDLPAAQVAEALAAAGDGNVGWIPTEDGGYACLALPRPLPGLFQDVPWSTDGVADATRNNARRLGVSLCEAGRWYDVDRPGDLDRLAADPEAARRCPATWTVLAEIREGGTA
jgi:rSAM/selenodomain-associated transferase 1